MLKFCVTVVVTLSLLYGGFVAIAGLLQRRLQYFPTNVDRKGAGNDVFRPWRDIAGQFWGYIRPSDSPERILVFFHGNGGEALGRSWVSDLVPDRKTLIVLAEYPGYGAKPGEPTESLIFQDARLIMGEIRRKWELLPILVVGESLGSGVASYVAGSPGVTRLALISPFDSAVNVAAHHYPYLPVRWLMQDRYESTKHVAKLVDIPLFVIHGTDDDIVPPESTRRLFESYPSSQKTMVALPGVGHNDIGPRLLAAPEARTFREFLSK